LFNVLSPFPPNPDPPPVTVPTGRGSALETPVDQTDEALGGTDREQAGQLQPTCSHPSCSSGPIANQQHTNQLANGTMNHQVALTYNTASSITLADDQVNSRMDVR